MLFNMAYIVMLFTLAFDTVLHKWLILKLQAYGVQGKLLSWLTSFLSDCFQCFSLNGSLSSWQPVSSGVPQGSVLGPLLLVICINDTSSIVFSYLFKFADDAKVCCSILNPSDIQLLQNDIDPLYHWSSNWLLNFSIFKCKAMHVG